jgi:ubiquinone/menaquinone biosynthesis C-methylase UbiE
MGGDLGHDLAIPKSRDNRARERFVSSLRAYVLNDMAHSMRQHYERRVVSHWEQEHGVAPEDGPEVHRAIRTDPYFKSYSSVRCTAQQMVWNTVINSVEERLPELAERGRKLGEDQGRAQGTLELDATLAVPDYVRAVDVHLMPGNYHEERAPDDVAAGAIYDNGLNVFAFGAMGKDLNDIGWSMANFVKTRFPKLNPERILDVGCTIGHNTVPWKETFPGAEVHACDVAAPCLRYAHARAQALGHTIHFHQRNAEDLRFGDASFDVVFSSMFLHELPAASIRRFLAEARRVLKPGGVMIHMELPPNAQLSAYDAFYLDWDGDYNNEPFYKGYRDQAPRALCVEAGFAAEAFFEGVMPRFTYVPEDAFRAAVLGEVHFDDDTGRLSDGIQWYGFGAHK